MSPGFASQKQNGISISPGSSRARRRGRWFSSSLPGTRSTTLIAVALQGERSSKPFSTIRIARGARSDLPARRLRRGRVPSSFITSDPLHGEQSILDTSRSFGAFCVLASQSVASLEHALAHGGGSFRQDESAVEILWNNTASKLVFRTTDPKTASRVDDLCPHRPGLAGVVRVRPVSTLRTGECYAILSDGRFERRQLHPFEPGRWVEVDPDDPLAVIDGGVEPCGFDEDEPS